MSIRVVKEPSEVVEVVNVGSSSYGTKPGLSLLSQKEVEYVKRIRVLSGESLYSHSWIEI